MKKNLSAIWIYLPVFEAIREEKSARSHESQDVAEYLPITVDEIMLFEGVQDDGNTTIEHLCQPRLREPAESKEHYIRVKEYSYSVELLMFAVGEIILLEKLQDDGDTIIAEHLFGSSTTSDRSTMHPKFNPTRVQSHNLQIMTIHFMSLRCLL